MFIYLVLSEHPVHGEGIIYAYQRLDRAVEAVKRLEEVAVEGTTYRVDSIRVEDM